MSIEEIVVNMNQLERLIRYISNYGGKDEDTISESQGTAVSEVGKEFVC